MKKLLCMLIIFAMPSYGQNDKLIETDNVGVISESLREIDQNTLVIFDCDDTLINCKDAIFQAGNRGFLRKIIKQQETENLDLLQQRKGTILINAQRELVNDKLPEIINNVQKDKGKALVLTAAIEESCGAVLSILDWRVNDLEILGFSFAQSWPNFQKTIFNTNVCFNKGILFSGNAPKSGALEIFLDFSKFKPKKIIFVDDKRKNVDDIAKFCKKKGIPFIGIHYTEALKNTSIFSKQRAVFQIEYVKKHDVWLSDSEADKLMEKQDNAQ